MPMAPAFDNTAFAEEGAMFGATPACCAQVWGLLRHSIPTNSSSCHLLWALLFLKVYASESVNASLAGCDEKTFRKWVWIFVRAIADLKLIEEPSPFDACWYSHKFKAAGLRYEVATGIYQGNIVWAHGPFSCDSFPDINIYRLRLKNMLLPHEKIVADNGYLDVTAAFGELNYDRGNWGYVQARHEAVNKRLKQFMVLSRRFRHPLHRHNFCFYAGLNTTHLLMEDDSPVFQ